eukprot:g73551.t1
MTPPQGQFQHFQTGRETFLKDSTKTSSLKLDIHRGGVTMKQRNLFVALTAVTFLFLVNLRWYMKSSHRSTEQLDMDDVLNKPENRPLALDAEKNLLAQDEKNLFAQNPLVRQLEHRVHQVAADARPARGDRAGLEKRLPPKMKEAVWKLHEKQSCQGYVDDSDVQSHDLSLTKELCVRNMECHSVMCPHGQSWKCTLRKGINPVNYDEEDCYLLVAGPGRITLHPQYHALLKRYPFQAVYTDKGQTVNIMLVRAPPQDGDIALIKQYEKEILFLGISSFEDYPLPAPNPFSSKYSKDKFVGLFPGFLHNMRNPDKVFPPHVKTILMSQSDFQLPDVPFRDYSVPKKYDFTLSGSDQDVERDCVGWSSFAKNWSFVKEALVVMCGEFNLTGVLAATMNKKGTKACTVPDSCKGKMLQTTFLTQEQFFGYLKDSRFSFLPQVHDASPRVATQALAHDVPILMNKNIIGGWKYIHPKTGESFHDMSDFRENLRTLLQRADKVKYYEPKKWVEEHYGTEKSGKRLFDYVLRNFGDRVEIPPDTEYLYI